MEALQGGSAKGWNLHAQPGSHTGSAPGQPASQPAGTSPVPRLQQGDLDAAALQLAGSLEARHPAADDDDLAACRWGRAGGRGAGQGAGQGAGGRAAAIWGSARGQPGDEQGDTAGTRVHLRVA